MSLDTRQIEQALGLTNVSLTVSAAGLATITATEPVTEAQQALVQVWYDAGAVSTHRSQSARVVLARLTPAERAALRACTVPAIQDAYDIALIEGTVSEADADFPAFKVALDQLGIIAAARWEALLAP